MLSVMTFPINIDPNFITDDNVHEICETAGYGIDYYATHAEGEFPEDAVFGVHIPDGGRDFFLTADEIRVATVRCAYDHTIQMGNWVRGYFLSAFSGYPDELDTGCIDATAADVIVQVAMFGKLVYG